jgi:hypothetical protein
MPQQDLLAAAWAVLAQLSQSSGKAGSFGFHN